MVVKKPCSLICATAKRPPPPPQDAPCAREISLMFPLEPDQTLEIMQGVLVVTPRAKGVAKNWQDQMRSVLNKLLAY
eukprot:1136292-Pelagomonas_calceolata.AAC.6